jgi:putative transposase
LYLAIALDAFSRKIVGWTMATHLRTELVLEALERATSQRRPTEGSITRFFATLECELLDRRRFQTQAEAKLALFQWIEGWYNPRRRHSSLGYLSPNEFERRHAEGKTGGLRPPHPPFTLESSEHQEGPGLESAQPSTETR